MDATSQEQQQQHHHKKKKKKKVAEAAAAEEAGVARDIRMDYVPSKEGLARPFVAYFPTGFDPVRAEDNGDGTPLAALKSYQGVDKMKAKQTELVASTQGRVDFVGANYTGEPAAWQPCSYALGVFDKENGTLKLVPLAGEKILRMEPRVRGVPYNSEMAEEEEHVEETREMGILKRRMLTETFGSQKSKMRAQRLERGLVKEEALGDANEMEILFQEAGQNESLFTNDQALQQANSAVVRNVPPYDLSASTPEGAYPLDKLITEEEWGNLDVHELKAAAKKAKDEDYLRQSKSYPNFVLTRLQRIRVEGDKEGNDRRARILVYMRHLLTFLNAPKLLLRKAGNSLGHLGPSLDDNSNDLSQELEIPGVIVARLLDKFTAESTSGPSNRPGVRVRQKEHEELLKSYILVLGLTVDDFQTDPFDIAVELKMTVSAIRPHYRELGCKFEARSVAERKELADPKTSQGKWRVTLPVPLKFPQIVVPRGRPGKGR